MLHTHTQTHRNTIIILCSKTNNVHKHRERIPHPTHRWAVLINSIRMTGTLWKVKGQF